MAEELFEEENYSSMEYYYENSEVHKGYEEAKSERQAYSEAMTSKWYYKLPIIKGNMDNKLARLSDEEEKWGSLNEILEDSYEDSVDVYDYVKRMESQENVYLVNIMQRKGGVIRILDDITYTKYKLQGQCFSYTKDRNYREYERALELYTKMKIAVDIDADKILEQGIRKMMNECLAIVQAAEGESKKLDLSMHRESEKGIGEL